jgi:GNAT superfamily N-acetyltransferase
MFKIGSIGAAHSPTVALARKESAPSSANPLRFSGTDIDGIIPAPPRSITFKTYTGTEATVDDLKALPDFYVSQFLEHVKNSIEDISSTMRNRSNEELAELMRRHKPDMKFVKTKVTLLKRFSPFLLALTGLKKSYQGTADFSETHIKSLKRRFIDNPQGALLIVKDSLGTAVGVVEINQFQSTRDFHIELGDMSAIDRKHCLINGPYIKPEHRGTQMETALTQAALRFAKEKLGYQYAWVVSDANTPIDVYKTLGAKPLRPGSQFTDSPAFTPEKITELLKEYNLNGSELHWINLNGTKLLNA